MTIRNSMRYGRSAGVITAFGIASGVSIHVGYTMLGFAILLQETTWLVDVLRVLGAGYLAWIGISSLLFRQDGSPGEQGGRLGYNFQHFAAFRDGFLCNALNPKTALFFLALFTQVISSETSPTMQLGVGLFIAMAHLFWFVGIALLITHSQFEQMILKSKRQIERITGACLLGLSAKLIFHTT